MPSHRHRASEQEYEEVLEEALSMFLHHYVNKDGVVQEKALKKEGQEKPKEGVREKKHAVAEDENKVCEEIEKALRQEEVKREVGIVQQERDERKSEEVHDKVLMDPKECLLDYESTDVVNGDDKKGERQMKKQARARAKVRVSVSSAREDIHHEGVKKTYELAKKEEDEKNMSKFSWHKGRVANLMFDDREGLSVQEICMSIEEKRKPQNNMNFFIEDVQFIDKVKKAYEEAMSEDTEHVTKQVEEALKPPIS
ncbi:hypothetical protein KI387_040355 [Taxus chinensis]|uniref:Uncharacterized protein n=1 Tax=Taxus chinensis TaxID=29808 RepID=A0AA38CCG8_TAXCH|nr:hypothetical protein KI387_040355 [Taxus chinensis]